MANEGEEGIRKVCTTGEAGDHGHQNREHWMRMQFEVKIMSSGSGSLNLRHGDICRQRCPMAVRDRGMECRKECTFLI